VDVAGQALALGQAAALALGRGQLAAGRLQLLDQPPALIALVDDPGDPEREQDPEGQRDQAADDRPEVLRQWLPRRQDLPPDDLDGERQAPAGSAGRWIGGQPFG
jgi:ABC-type amino acid transport substrate-binding protein